MTPWQVQQSAGLEGRDRPEVGATDKWPVSLHYVSSCRRPTPQLHEWDVAFVTFRSPCENGLHGLVDLHISFIFSELDLALVL